MLKKGDTNFGSFYASLLQLLRMYSVSETVQHQFLGYGFEGTFAKVFLKMQSDARNAQCSPAELWQLMAKKLFNSQMIQGQRANLTAAALKAKETVSGLADRLYELAVDLAKMDCEAGDDVLFQRLIDAVPDDL